jgi:hypothetical protein
MTELKDKIASISIIAATSVMFFSIVFLTQIISELTQSEKILGLVTAGLTSFGIYKLIAGLILYSFNKSQWLRKQMLGRAFLEGTWVGHWIHDGKNVFTIETIDQENGETIITGRQIGDDLKTQADWSSESVFVDLRRERIIYVYSCDVYRTNHQQNGIGVFKMIRPERNAAPDVLDGYAVDTIDGTKDVNREHKISDKIVETKKAIEEARKIFNV